jgi:hypothetical protein
MDDWRYLLSLGANVLLEGSDRVIDQVIAVMTPHLRHPIQTCPHWPPQAMPSEGALILRDTATLNADEQRTLLHWLDNAGAQVQVIAAASSPLFPLVLEGRFLHSLYYRLNILYIAGADALSICNVG